MVFSGRRRTLIIFTGNAAVGSRFLNPSPASWEQESLFLEAQHRWDRV